MELLRILKKTWRYTLLILAAIIVLCLFNINSDNDTKLNLYIEKIQDGYENAKATMSDEEAMAYIDKEIRWYFKENPEAEDEEYVRSAYSSFCERKSYIDNYNKNLSDKISNVRTLLSSPMYSDRTGFGRLNIIKSSIDMSKLVDVEVSISNTTAIEKLMNFKELPLLCLIIMILVNMAFVEERSNGIWKIVYSGANGRFKLGAKRCAILLLVSFIVSFMANAVIFGIYLFIYGGAEDLGNAIQSSQMFSMFSLHINIGQFFILYCVAAAVGMYALSLLMLVIIMCIKSNKLSIMCLLIVYIIEVLLYNNITANSSLCLLRYINIYNFILPAQSYMSYENWGYNGFITDICFSTIIMTIVVALPGIIAVIVISVREKPEGKIGVFDRIYGQLVQIFQKAFSRTPLSVMELYKVFILQRGAIIILIAVYLITGCKLTRGVDYSEQNNYIKAFYEEFDGAEPSAQIDNYIDNFESRYEIIKAQVESGNGDEFVLKTMNSALTHMQQKNDYVKKINDEKGIEAVIVNSNTYDDVFGDRMFTNQDSINVVCILAIILILSGAFAFEKKCGMNVLLRTYQNRKKEWTYKAILVLVVTFVIWLVAVIINWANIIHIYDFNQLNAPIQSLMEFENYPLEISISAYILFTMLYRLVLLISVAYIVFCISAFMDYMKSIIVSVIFLIPYLLYVLKLDIMFYLSIVPAFDFNRYWNLYNIKWFMYYIPMLLVALAVVMVAKCYKKIAK